MMGRKKFFYDHEWVYWLIMIPVYILFFGWAIAGQFTVYLAWRNDWNWNPPPSSISGWDWLVMVLFWFTVPIYGCICLVISYTLQNFNEKEIEIDRAMRTSFNNGFPRKTPEELKDEIEAIEAKYK